MKTFNCTLKQVLYVIVVVIINGEVLSQTNTNIVGNNFDLVLYEGNSTGNTKFGSRVARVGDLNGDGFGDFLISSIFRTYVYWGGDNLDSIPEIVFDNGELESSYGDLNNDGVSDLIISDDEKVYIYFGGSNMDAVTDIILKAPDETDGFGNSLSCNGDLNNDGYDDIVVGASGSWKQKGRAYVYFGGSTVGNLPDIVLEGKIEERGYFSSRLSSEGDLNNDGFDDLMVKEGDSLYIYSGGVVMDSIIDLALYWNGYAFSTAGDINNDGFDDLICGDLSSNNYGKACVYLGGVNMDTIADITINGTAENEWAGIGVSIPGDLNNDGYDDFTIGCLSRATGMSLVCTQVYYGNSNPDTIADLIINGGRMSSNDDYQVAPVGDVNNDGFIDIIIGEHYWGMETGRASIFLGGSIMDTIADVVLEGKRNNNQFGYSVASGGDINNDGYDDLLVSAYGYKSKEKSGRVYLYLGGESTDTIADKVLEYEEKGRLGRCVAPAGDVNNDGYDDFIVSGGGKALVYFGDTVIKDTPTITLFQDVTDFAIDVASAGDVNNDGYDDIIIGSKVDSYNKGGLAFIYFGGENMDDVVDVTLMEEQKIKNYFGYTVSSAGDVNGDGYEDVIVGAYVYPQIGRAYIYFGGDEMDAEADIILQGSYQNEGFGYSVSSAGDVNGDGYGDVFIGAENWGSSYIYFGGSNMDHTPNISFRNNNDASFQVVSSAGDINNDGYDDVAIGAYRKNSYKGQCLIYYGGIDMDNIEDVVFDGENVGDYLGNSVACAGDVNNDGISDLIIGAYRYDLLCGRAYVYYGDIPVTFNEQPQDVGICAGDTAGFSVVTTNGEEYQWQVKNDSDTIYKNIENGVTYINSTMPTLSINTTFELTNNKYRCEVKNNYQTKYSEEAVLQVHPIPTATLVGDTAICEGDSINLAISLTGTAPWNFNISDGTEQVDILSTKNTSIVSIDSVGVYKLIALSDSNCSDTTTGNYLSFAVHPRPTSTLMGDTTICEGGYAKLDAHLKGTPPWTFVLSNTSSSQSFISTDTIYSLETDSSGVYSIIALNDALCLGHEMVGDAIVKVKSLPTSMLCGPSNLCKEDSTQICILFTGKYPWEFTFTDGVTNNEFYTDKNPYSIYIDKIGTYKIVVLQDANCLGTKMEGEVTIDECSLIDETTKERIQIYPNPNNGHFTVDNLRGVTRLEILNMMGQIIYMEEIHSSTIEIDLPERIEGVHILRLFGGDRVMIEMINIK